MSSHRSARSRRERTGRADRMEWVRRFERSELTRLAFAQQHRLGLSTLSRWLREGREERAAAPIQFQEVSVDQGHCPSCWIAEMSRPDGTIVRIGAGISPELLDQLMGLRSC